MPARQGVSHSDLGQGLSWSTIDDAVKAFVPGPRRERPPAGEGPLSGRRFAVKDLFDVAGAPTTYYGNPPWSVTHPAAVATAPPVTAPPEAGARLAGKTKTVERAFGLTGENVRHGTPLNPKAPDRFPGGSRRGSAAAVAGGLMDFAPGSDAGGSVRIPAWENTRTDAPRPALAVLEKPSAAASRRRRYWACRHEATGMMENDRECRP